MFDRWTACFDAQRRRGLDHSPLQGRRIHGRTVRKGRWISRRIPRVNGGFWVDFFGIWWGYHSRNGLRTGLKLVKYHTCSHSWEDHGNSGYDWNIMDWPPTIVYEHIIGDNYWWKNHGILISFNIWLLVWNHGILWLSISYMGISYPKVTFTPSFFKMLQTTNQVRSVLNGFSPWFPLHLVRRLATIGDDCVIWSSDVEDVLSNL